MSGAPLGASATAGSITAGAGGQGRRIAHPLAAAIVGAFSKPSRLAAATDGTDAHQAGCEVAGSYETVFGGRRT